MTSFDVPVVAPEGTVAVISVGETTVNDAETPLNVTLVAPVVIAEDDDAGAGPTADLCHSADERSEAEGDAVDAV